MEQHISDQDEQIIIDTMEEAFRKDQFVVYYQPKYDMHTEMIVGAEALVRWQHPVLGLLTPMDFIYLFEQKKCMMRLDTYVWEKVCQDLLRWREKSYPCTAVSINISLETLLDQDVMDVIVRLLKKYDIPVSWLHLEVTEDAYHREPEIVSNTVRKLRDFGFIIELDNFGSGEASLRMLVNMPIDILKIDLNFLLEEQKHNSNLNLNVVSAVIKLANLMNLGVIVEGVERAEQISSLLSMDCNYVQGFYYAKPLTREAFEILLKTSAVAELFSRAKKEQEEEEQAQEEALRKTRMKSAAIDYNEISRYRYILDNLDVAFFEVDEHDNFYASDKFSLYAISENNARNVMTNSEDYSGVHGDDIPLLFEFFQQIKQKLPKVSTTLRLKLKDGTYRFTEMMAFFEYNKQGKRTRIIGIFRDVDQEWIRQNKKLQEALEIAEKANQAKTDFLARVSHDMRTPLNGILGLSRLMEEKAKEAGLEQEIQQLEQSGSYLLNLIDDTLDVSKIESGIMELHPSVCDGKTAFNTVIAMVKPNMEEKNIQFHLSADNLPFTKLYVDVVRVEQIVMNVLSNAIKFTPEGGSIEFIMENISKDQGMITDRIIVRDTGIGMSKDFQKHLFEPFTQEHNNSKSVYQGTGLGMTIVKQCIELMGGSITVKSEENNGTEVVLIIPMPIATEEQIEAWKKAKEMPATVNLLQGKRILLCEDHPLNATIAIKLLEKKGMLVERAENGQVGVDMFNASREYYYDAILMDIRMPVKDGLEATREIRKMNRMDAQEIPIIAMTANALREDVRHAINAGMSEHLGKPIEPKKLYQTLLEFMKSPQAFMGKKVLIVDDIEMNRDFLRKAIKTKYKVFEANNGIEALEILKKEKDMEAVITDIQMPGMDGKQLIKHIRKNPEFAHLAILANTIYGDHRQEDELLSLGADDFVYKPTSARVILMRLEHILHNKDME